MRRALLLSGGTVGGLGVLLAVVHANFDSNAPLISAAATSTQMSTALPTPTSSLHAVPTSLATHAAPTPKATHAVSPAPTSPTRTTPTSKAMHTALEDPSTTPALKKISGTFSGDVVDVNYGNVQVQITVVDGKITDVQALEAPNGRSDRYTQYAMPILRDQTLESQSSAIEGASGASYTSYGWYTSLQTALAKAGL